MAKISIPRSENPLRMQASLGGNNIYRSVSEADGNSFLVQGVVTKVYYQKGTLDFSVINEASIVQNGEGTDGTQSAPIPVDFFGSNAEGQVYGHYRPVQTGSNIVVAYLKGKKANPIVVGVYPKSTDDYELISPATQNTADDNDSDVQDLVLGDKYIYPSGQILYRTGSGNIMESMNGKSFMAITQDSMEYYEDIWHTYDAVGCFYDNDANQILSKQTMAGSWVLVHEDNNQSDDSADGHMTRFYVNNHGKFQIVFGNYNDSSNLVVLEGSKDDGIIMSKLFDTNNLQDTSSDYVTMNVGKDHTISLKSATMNDSVAQSSTFEVKSDDIYVNGEKLSSYVGGIPDIDVALNNSDNFNDLKKITANAANAASEASTKAKQAGEDAKDAAVAAEQAGEDAKAQSKDIKDKIIYYTSISPESAGDYYVPGKFLHLTELTFIDDALIKTAMIQDEAVDTSKIANLAVGSAQMEDLAVTREKIGNLAVGSAQIEDLAVTDEKVGTLSFVHMAGQTLDANEINVVNLTGDNIKVGTITADKLIITSLGDITSNLGKVTSGEINAGTDSSSGVVINNLPADQPDVYTAQKKVALKQQIALIESEANSAIDYGTQTGNDTTQLMTDKTALLSGTSSLLSDLATTSNFDHTKIDTWLATLRKDIDDFQTSVNSSLSAKISETANGKNSIYTGTQSPSSPQENDIWIKDNGNGTTTIQVYGNGSWYTPSDQALKSVAAQVELLPKSYYSSTQPTGTDYKDGDLWYQISTNKVNNTVVYTPYKWNHDTNSWDPMLDLSSSHNYVGSAPSSPTEGDFWMDNTTLKQYQSGNWVVVPTKGADGIPGSDGKTYYTWIKYATDSSGSNISNTPTGMSYIGLAYNKESADESSTPTDYTWSLIKGDKGIPGAPGADGKTSYFHIAYANSADGKDRFYVGGVQNLLSNSRGKFQPNLSRTDNGIVYATSSVYMTQGQQYTVHANASSGLVWSGTHNPNVTSNNIVLWLTDRTTFSQIISDANTGTGTTFTWNHPSGTHYFRVNTYKSDNSGYVENVMLEKGTVAHPWSPAPSETHSNYMGTYTDYTQAGSTDTTRYTWVPMFDSTKKRNFTTQPTTPYAVGDTWTQSGATYFCKTARNSGAFTASDWTMQQLTIQSMDSSVTNSLYNNNLFLNSGSNSGQTILPGGTPAISGTYSRTASYEQITPPSSGECYYRFTNPINNNLWGLVAGETYTISGQAVVNEGTLLFRAQASDGPGWYNFFGDSRYDLKATNSDGVTYTSFSYTFTIPTSATGIYLSFQTYDYTANTVFRFKKMKLEKGSVATPWCLSQSEITTTTGNYKGVTLNDAGLTATAGSTTVAMNSTDGFLIKKNSGQIFHVDTAGNLTMQGNITAGNISGVNFTGNSSSLANTLNVTGAISASSGNTVINSNGLTIKGGNLSLQDSSGHQTTYLQSDGTFVTNKGIFSGSVSASQLIVNGGDKSDINLGGGKFHVDKDGNLYAKSATLTNGTINSSVINGSQFLAGDAYPSLLDGNTHNNVSLSSGGTLVGGGYHSSLDRSEYITIGGIYKEITDTQNTGTSAADISSPNLFTVDGSKLSNGDKILVKLSINYDNYIGQLGTRIALQSKTSSPILFSEQSMIVGYYTYNFIINWSSSLGTGKVIFNLKGIGLQANSHFYVVGARFYTNHGGSGDNYYESTTALRSDGTLSLKDYIEEVSLDGTSKYYNGLQWDQGEMRLSYYHYNYNTAGGVSNITSPYFESNLSSQGLKFIGGNPDPNLEFFGDVSHEAIIQSLGYMPWGVSYNNARGIANGIYFDKFGNIHGYQSSDNWSINGGVKEVAHFPLNNKNDIVLSPPLGYNLQVNGSIVTPWSVHASDFNGFKLAGNNIKAAYGNGFFLDNAGGNGGNADLHVRSVSQSSLLSLKTNIAEIDSGTALNLIKQTEIYNYQFKEDVANGVTKHYASYIIDDVNDTPQYKEPEEFLSNDKKGRDDGSLLSYTVLAIQELSKQVDTLKQQISNYESNNKEG